MLKFLLTIILLGGIYFLLFRKKKTTPKPAFKKDENITNELIQCEKCDTFIDIKEAKFYNGKYFCSEECLRN
jgi:uncharacterized protein